MGRPATGRTTGTLGVRLSHAELTGLYRPAANLSLYVTQDGFSLKVNPRKNGAGDAVAFSDGMTEFLAIDPGTLATGYAIFKDGQPQDVGVYQADKRQTADQRTTAVIGFVAGLVASKPSVDPVVCEQWLGPRNPQLQTLITALGQTVKRQGLGWQLYHNSSVFSSVCPRGYRAHKREQRKKAILDGVLGLYPELRFALAKFNPEYTQDALDAVAVGVCHLGAEKVKALERSTSGA